jgi:hypothetical protein
MTDGYSDLRVPSVKVITLYYVMPIKRPVGLMSERKLIFHFEYTSYTDNQSEMNSAVVNKK